MYFPYKSIQHLSTQNLQELKQKIYRIYHQETLCENPLCGGCRFFQCCKNPPPCKAWGFSPYLPLHILKALVELGLVPQSAVVTQKRKKLVIFCKGFQKIRLSYSAFMNGQEARQNLLQVLLRNPTLRNTKIICRRENLIRFSPLVLANCSKCENMYCSRKQIIRKNRTQNPTETTQENVSRETIFYGSGSLCSPLFPEEKCSETFTAGKYSEKLF